MECAVMVAPPANNPVVGLVDSIDDPGLLCMRVVPDYSDQELKAHPESIPTWIGCIFDAQ